MQHTTFKRKYIPYIVAVMCIGMMTSITISVRADTTPSPLSIFDSQLTDATLIGQGILKIYWAQVYHLSYYTTDENKDGQADAIILHYDYLRDVPKYATIDASRDEFKRYPQITDEKLATWIGYLEQALSDMYEGDQAIIKRQADGTISFYVGDAEPVIISDEEFSQVFFDIWLGPESTYPSLRKQLLALN